VEREQLALLMTAADVLLYPTQADNHSMVLLEAMAHALPVVAYDVGGVPEQILHGSNGLLVKAGDEEAFVEKSVALLADHIVSRDLGQNAYSSGKKRFSVERMVQDYLKLYRDLNSR
jgi:glycosyltransferase involved in cell wall biosynthesis